MNKLFVLANLSKERYFNSVRKCIEQLEKNGFVCQLPEDDYYKIYTKGYKNHFSIEECDYITSLGGDGSFLIASKTALKYDKKIFGINLGHVGFLCRFKRNETKSITPEFLSTVNVNEKTVLEFTYNNEKHYAVNEVIVAKNNFGGTIELEAKCNDRIVSKFKADGLMLATPVGSSGYNSSCGGPILNDDSRSFVMTAICPNNSSFRTEVFSDSDKYELILIDNKYKASVYSDGQIIGEYNDEVVVKKSKKKIKIVK